MKKLILVATLSMVAAGCAQQTFVMSSEVSATTNDALPAKEQSQHFFIDGIAQDKEIDAAAVCGGADKVVKVEVQQTFTNVVLDVVTFGIYTPREARVYCKS